MFSEVFSFAQKPNDGVGKRGIITNIDVTIFEVCVSDSNGEIVCVSVDPHDCSEALRGIVNEGGEFIRVECDHQNQHCVRIYLMANKHCLKKKS